MIIWHLRADDDLNLKLKLQVIYFLLIVILLLTADSQSTTSPFITFPRMRWIICSFNKQPFIRESSHFSRHEETGCLSGGDIMTEGIIGGSENEKENRAEPPSDEGRRIWGDKRPKWSAERPGGKTGFFLSCSFICLCLSGRAKVIHVCPSNAVGSSPRDLKGGWSSKGFGSETRRGELWPLSGSPWWLLLCLLSHQTFVAHFSLSFSACGLFCPEDMATDSQPPPPTFWPTTLQSSLMWGPFLVDVWNHKLNLPPTTQAKL